jgi:hypothetical protein
MPPQIYKLNLKAFPNTNQKKLICKINTNKHKQKNKMVCIIPTTGNFTTADGTIFHGKSIGILAKHLEKFVLILQDYYQEIFTDPSYFVK